jgi:ATP-binding cassette subfamily B protein
MLVLLSSTMMVTAPIMMVDGVVMALQEDLGLSWLVGVSTPALLAGLGVVRSQMLPSYRVMQVRLDEVNKTLREQITGIRVVSGVRAGSFETARFDAANHDVTAVALRVGRWMA